MKQEIQINLGAWGSIFAVPCCVVDQHIRLASGNCLKVLLYLLRHAGEQVSLDHIADELKMPAEDVADALTYWCESHILVRSESGVFLPADNTEDSMTASSTEKEGKPSHQNIRLPSPPPRRKTAHPSSSSFTPPSSREIAARIDENEEIRLLFQLITEQFGRPLTPTEQKSLIYLYDYIGISADVIAMITAYCLSIGKSSMNYIEKTAQGWAEEGISTHELAEARIARLQERHTAENKVRQCFGIQNRALSANEKKFIAKWTEDFQFGMDMIQLAYERTVDTIGKVSFPYTNSILQSWHEKHIHTPQQALEDISASPKTAAARIQKVSPSYNLDEFDAAALRYTPKIPKQEG